MTPETARAFGLTDPGLTRSGNEDSFLVETPLYAVADGMGGHRAGEVASSVALEELLAQAPARADAKALARAVRAANQAVIAAAGASRTRSGMGTTLTAVMVDGTRLAVAHVGDSRAYLLHDGVLTRITEDHSMVADLVRAGTLTEDEARRHPQRSVITRALGSDVEMSADAFELDAAVGDRLLLCTDGLSGMVDDGAIAAILRDAGSPEAAASRLIAAANDAGGHDNITVVVVDLGVTPASELAPTPGSSEQRRRISARLLWLVAAIALVATAIGGTYSIARSRVFLGVEEGRVTIFRGFPDKFAGVSLRWREQRTSIRVDVLRPEVAERLAGGIRTSSLADAEARVEEMRRDSLIGEPPPPPGGSAPATVAPLP